jgi:REP element-mobilizing transposase RayT
MARKTRIEFPGAMYHVLDRGDRREAIFLDDEDRRQFVRTLGETCARTGWRIHAFVLMGNHYHLLVETPEANLVAGMRWFQTTWTVRFNRRHRLSGHLLQGRYKAVVVDPEEGAYYATLSDYIHLNPVRARIVSLEERLYDYRWSSYPWYVATKGRLMWFEPRMVMGELGFEDDAEGRRLYAQRMRQRAVDCLTENETPALAEIRRGWCLGSESFREQMLNLIETPGDELPGLPRGDARKMAIAALIREHTAVPNSWIAEALSLGHVSRVSRCRTNDRRFQSIVAHVLQYLESDSQFTD